MVTSIIVVKYVCDCACSLSLSPSLSLALSRWSPKTLTSKSHVLKILGESEKIELRPRCLDVDSFLMYRVLL